MKTKHFIIFGAVAALMAAIAFGVINHTGSTDATVPEVEGEGG